MNLDERKSAVRALVRARMASLDRAGASRRVCEHLERAGAPGVALGYAPMRSEVNIEPVLRGWLASGVTVCVPRIDWASGTMSPAQIEDFDADLTPGEHGVREPRPGCAEVAWAGVGLVLVPGVAFDAAGGRLGRGGGFYDRCLRGLRARAVGVAFAAQVVDEVPCGAQDVRVGGLVTETGWVFGG